MSETDDLVRRAQKDDRQALETLITKVDQYVFGVALLTLGERSEAQDAAQEALIKAMRGLKRYRGHATFRTWLYRITINTCRDFQRRRARQREMPLDDQARVPVVGGPGHTHLARESRQVVWDAVQSLEPVLREVVVLRYYLDMACTEISEVLKTPVNTVYWRLHQARQLLKPRLLAEDILVDEISARSKIEEQAYELRNV